MQMTDGRHDGQAEPVTGKAAAPIETVEPGDDLHSLLGCDAGALVLNDDRHGLSVFSRSNSHSSGAAAVLERVVDQVGRRAREEILVAENRRLADHIDDEEDRKSTRLNSSHEWISYAVLCLKKEANRR